MALTESQRALPHPLGYRLRQQNLSLSGHHETLAAVLFEDTTMHLSHCDVVCLMLLQNPASKTEATEACLDDFVEWSVIQRIHVDARRKFYDTNTRPHLHVFDASSGVLHDAPADGVIIASTNEEHAIAGS